MAKTEITKRVPARDVITGNVMMDRYFKDGNPMVLIHTFAERHAFNACRQYSTWPRYSMPDEARTGRPPLKLQYVIL